MKRKIMKRWDANAYVVDGSVVGTVMEDPFRRGWWAYGCLEDWEDTKLGLHDEESQARKRVEQWVTAHG
jgi:hypothetical protein